MKRVSARVVPGWVISWEAWFGGAKNGQYCVIGGGSLQRQRERERERCRLKSCGKKACHLRLLLLNYFQKSRKNKLVSSSTSNKFRHSI